MNEIETKSKPAELGDMVVARDDNGKPGEQYLVKAEKFPQLYNTQTVTLINDEWDRYWAIPELRSVLRVRSDHYSLMDDDYVFSQEEMAKFVNGIKDEWLVSEKKVTVLARQAKEGEVVVTRTRVSDGQVMFKFVAPWGEEMIVREGDYLVIKDNEVYRIGKYEFELTYEIVK